MKYLAKVNAKYFAAATVFMAEKDVRYYLCGVCIQPHPEGGAAIVATNGYAMFVIRDPDAEVDREYIVGGISRQLVTACKTRKADHVYIMSDMEGHATGGTHWPGAVVVSSKPDEGEDQGMPQIWDERVQRVDQIKILAGTNYHRGKYTDRPSGFPDWRAVCKFDPENMKPTSIQTKYLSAPQEAMQIMIGKSWSQITIYQQGDNRPLFFRVMAAADANLDNCLMVIKPCGGVYADSHPVRKELVHMP